MGSMQRAKAWVKGSDAVAAKLLRRLALSFFSLCNRIEYGLTVALFHLFRLFPLQDKVVASNFSGKRYGDNTKAVYEYLRSKGEGIRLVWVVKKPCRYPLPRGIEGICRDNVFSFAYHYATAKVWIDTHVLPASVRKRKGQMFIETWHGGLGIKRIFNQRNDSSEIVGELADVRHMDRLADLFISNSDHLSRVYREALGYEGPIWKCGYPKNDRLLGDPTDARERVRRELGLPRDARILVYAPTFRGPETTGDPCDVAAAEVLRALIDRFGGQWYFLIRLHPIAKRDGLGAFPWGDTVRDVTDYPDFQELVLGCDAFLSDYSSGIFDAALLQKPCFVYAKDFEDYKNRNGVYYELEELPFPCAFTNEGLAENIRRYDREQFLQKWSAFAERTGLHETGRASEEVGELIVRFIHEGPRALEDIKHACEW